MEDNQKAQGAKPEHEDQGKHLGQQKQAAGEIGKDAAHGKSGQPHPEDDDQEDEGVDLEPGGDANDA